MTSFHSRAPVIRAVVSDVDGTLVTSEKVLTERAIAAVTELHRRAIPFTIISSRPPRGMRMLVAPLQISLPIAAFNGGIIATPSLETTSEHLIPENVAHSVLSLFRSRGVQTWLFSGEDWLVRDCSAPDVEHEQHTVGFAPRVVDDLMPFLARAAKIVGVSQDHALLANCEQVLRKELIGSATIACSQLYYLDITHPLANKGDALAALARILGVTPEETAVIGDGNNDIAMFLRSGFSVAMGNASDEVKTHAKEVTASNNDEGFAQAIERLILPHIGARPVNMDEDRQTFATVSDLARSTADWFCGLALASGGPFVVCLSGGSTPRVVYEALAERAGEFPWARSHWFWGDERFVPHEDPDSTTRTSKSAISRSIAVRASDNLVQLAHLRAKIHDAPLLVDENARPVRGGRGQATKRMFTSVAGWPACPSACPSSPCSAMARSWCRPAGSWARWWRPSDGRWDPSRCRSARSALSPSRCLAQAPPLPC
jgi:Cof subfamily protein (haloacid dehalogenase superfamily)